MKPSGSKLTGSSNSGSKGLTPNKQKRRPGGGQPSTIKPFSIKGTKNGS